MSRLSLVTALAAVTLPLTSLATPAPEQAHYERFNALYLYCSDNHGDPHAPDTECANWAFQQMQEELNQAIALLARSMRATRIEKIVTEISGAK